MSEGREIVAVTGATGFVGRALTRELLRLGSRVRALSRREKPPGHGVEWVRGDVADRGAVRELVGEASRVFHLASFVHRRPRGQQDLEELRRTNVDGTRALVEEARSARAFVFVSSTAVYGSSPCPWTEDSVCRPQTAYGQSKLDAERLVLSEHPRAGVIRPSAIVGDGAPGSFAMLDRLVRWGLVPVVDGGRARKSFTHVDTVVRAAFALADRLARGELVDRVFVVTDDEPCSVAEMAALRARAARARPRLVSLDATWLTLGAAAWDRTRGALRLPLPSGAALVETLAGEAVASNARMRERLGIVPAPTAQAFLGDEVTR